MRNFDTFLQYERPLAVCFCVKLFAANLLHSELLVKDHFRDIVYPDRKYQKLPDDSDNHRYPE